MDENIRNAIFDAVKKEPFARELGMTLKTLDDGHSVVEMIYDPDKMNNIYDRTHGGAIFGLIDEAFETASQTAGTIAVALNVNVTYISSPEPGARLRSEAKRVSRTRKTAVYDIDVVSDDGNLIATCKAVAYCTGKPIPFLSQTQAGSPSERRRSQQTR